MEQKIYIVFRVLALVPGISMLETSFTYPNAATNNVNDIA
jgi:hypothetical protein